MIKNVLLTLTIFVLTLSCNRTQKEVILTFADGKPELVYETKDVNGEKQRVAEEMFYNSGKVRYKRSFKDNKPYGVWEYYYENGNLFAKADFSNSNIGENSTLAQQLSAFSHGVAQAALAAQLSAWQHVFSTHSVFGQHSLAHSPLSAFLQQQLIAQNATAAISKIFFILLKFLKIKALKLIRF